MEKTRTKLPESVAVRAIVAIAHNHAGELGEYEVALAELKDLSPDAPHDYLLKAQAQSFADPIQATTAETMRCSITLPMRSRGAQATRSWPPVGCPWRAI